MKTSADYLDDLQSHLGVTTDAAVARALKMKPQQVTRYRTLDRAFSAATARRVAAALGRPEIAGEIMVAMLAQVAREPEEKAAWGELSKKLSGVGAALLLSVGFSLSPTPSPAAQLETTEYYVKLSRRLLQALRLLTIPGRASLAGAL